VVGAAEAAANPFAAQAIVRENLVLPSARSKPAVSTVSPSSGSGGEVPTPFAQVSRMTAIETGLTAASNSPAAVSPQQIAQLEERIKSQLQGEMESTIKTQVAALLKTELDEFKTHLLASVMMAVGGTGNANASSPKSPAAKLAAPVTKPTTPKPATPKPVVGSPADGKSPATKKTPPATKKTSVTPVTASPKKDK